MDVPYQGRRNQGGENRPLPDFGSYRSKTFALERALDFTIVNPLPLDFQTFLRHWVFYSKCRI